jgi:hypothetical protein
VRTCRFRSRGGSGLGCAAGTADGCSHTQAVVGSIVCRTTASNSAVRVSRSSWSRSAEGSVQERDPVANGNHHQDQPADVGKPLDLLALCALGTPETASSQTAPRTKLAKNRVHRASETLRSSCPGSPLTSRTGLPGSGRSPLTWGQHRHQWVRRHYKGRRRIYAKAS